MVHTQLKAKMIILQLTKIGRACLLCVFVLACCPQPPAYASSLTDDSGQQLSFEKPFARIISLYPAHTENLFALGLDSEIVGVSSNDDYPEQATTKPQFHYREDPEKFIAAQPDLVLVRPMIFQGYPNLIEKLQLAGITVASLQPTSLEETFAYWRQLGLLTGRTSQADAMTAAFQKELAIIGERIKKIPEANRRKVYFESIHSKMKTFAPQSITIFTLQAAGGINLASDAKTVRSTNIAAYGKEHILALAADIDVYLAQQGKMNRITIAAIQDEPGFQVIKAVRENQIFLVDEKIVSRPTSRLLEGVRTIAGMLYPDQFNSHAGGQ